MLIPHAITQLTLENFRNYRSLQLNVSAAPVVLMGHNGAGKTNILEAISLLSPGRGLRSAKLREMDRQDSGYGIQDAGSPWVVAAKMLATNGEIHLGTGRESSLNPESRIPNPEKRLIKINGEKVRAQAELTQHASIQWLTPAMDQVFVEGGSARRKLLDRMVYGFEPAHAARVTAFESAMRERNKLLADYGRADPYWLSVLEQQMAEHGVAMTLARTQTLARVQEELQAETSSFPRAVVALEGVLENWLGQGQTALEVETKFAERLKEVRGVDAASGRASTGPQRSQLIVIHNEKNMPAERCSTGEQKALLLSLILAAARARARWCGTAPILLLDEVVAHLDVDKRASLFELLRMAAIQAWMTGTDAADFQGLQGFATTLEIAGGAVVNRVEN